MILRELVFCIQRRIMKRLIYRFNSISLRNRLMLVFVLLIITPLIFQGLLSLSILSDSVISRYESEMDYRFSQLEKRIDELFGECCSVLFSFAYRSEIQAILQNEYEGESLIESRYIVETILLDGRLNSGITYSIFVYDLEGNCYTNDYLDMIDYADVIESDHIGSSHLFSNTMLKALMRSTGIQASLWAGRYSTNRGGRESAQS